MGDTSVPRPLRTMRTNAVLSVVIQRECLVKPAMTETRLLGMDVIRRVMLRRTTHAKEAPPPPKMRVQKWLAAMGFEALERSVMMETQRPAMVAQLHVIR